MDKQCFLVQLAGYSKLNSDNFTAAVRCLAEPGNSRWKLPAIVVGRVANSVACCRGAPRQRKHQPLDQLDRGKS